MKKFIRISAGTALCALALLLQGCTKEKAEAIKLAAETLRAEASEALNQLRTLLGQNIGLPPRDNDKLAADLRESNFTYEMLQTLLTEDQIGAPETESTDRQIDEIETHYTTFAQMFGELPSGHYFAADAVKKAEAHAVNLTMEMIQLARLLEEEKIPVRLNAKRILLVEQIRQHNDISDETLRQAHLKNATQQILSLAAEEEQLREQAILQCLKAAEAGRLLTTLIRDYGTLSAAEILTLTQQSLGAAAALSGQNANVVALLNKYQAVESTIKADPYWSQLLQTKVRFNDNPGE